MHGNCDQESVLEYANTIASTLKLQQANQSEDHAKKIAIKVAMLQPGSTVRWDVARTQNESEEAENPEDVSMEEQGEDERREDDFGQEGEDEEGDKENNNYI